MMCMIRFTFCRPASPSLYISSSFGMIGISSWMMMDAVMYGYTPMAATE